jgi:hypothetical protein
LLEGFAKAANPVLLDAFEPSSLGWVWLAECDEVVAPTEVEAKADFPKAVEEENGPGAPGNAGFPNALDCPNADVVVAGARFPVALDVPKGEAWAEGVPKAVQEENDPNVLGLPNALGCPEGEA